MGRPRFSGIALILLGVLAGCGKEPAGPGLSSPDVLVDTLDARFAAQYPEVSLALTLLALLPYAPEYQDTAAEVLRVLFHRPAFQQEVMQLWGWRPPTLLPPPHLTGDWTSETTCDEAHRLDHDLSRKYVAYLNGYVCVGTFIQTERIDERGRGSYYARMDASWDMFALASLTYDNAFYTVDRNWSLRSTNGDPDSVGDTTQTVEPRRCVAFLDLIGLFPIPVAGEFQRIVEIIREMYERASEAGGPDVWMLCGFTEKWKILNVWRRYSRIPVNGPRWRKTAFEAGMHITNAANFSVLNVAAGITLW